MPGPETGSNPARLYPRSRPPNLLRCIAIAAIVFLILVGLAILIFWLVVRPSKLEYSVDEASVHGFNLTGANELNASFNLTLRADNHNHRVGVYYDTFDVEVWISDQRVAFTEVAPFYQGHRNVTTIEVDPMARSVPLLTSVADNIKHDRTAGVVEMEVRVRARIRFKVGLAKTRHYVMTVDCSPVVVHFARSTRFVRTYCDVDI